MSETYDSRQDTQDHINQVRVLLAYVVLELEQRARVHDASKLEDPEKAVFDRMTPKLRAMTYGTAEYMAALAEMGEGLQHHYAFNQHHPEHWPNGIADMSMLDIIEMLADWKAATLRHDDGDLGKSIMVNRERFGYDEAFARMLVNTASEMGWL